MTFNTNAAFKVCLIPLNLCVEENKSKFISGCNQEFLYTYESEKPKITALAGYIFNILFAY